MVVDLPGHGDSGVVRADLRRTADLLAATSGQGTYVGYSLGGRAAPAPRGRCTRTSPSGSLLGATPGIVDDDERAMRRAADERLAVYLLEIGVDEFLDEWSAQPLFDGLVLDADERADRRRNSAEGLASSLSAGPAPRCRCGSA